MKELQLSENNLSSIPDWISELISLKALRLGGNKIQIITPELVKLTSLEILHLGGNKIEIIPSWIASLPALETLDLQDNLINTPIAEIENLDCLIDLNLSSNGLNTIPESLLTSPAGLHRRIDLEFNPISPAEAARLSALALAGGATLIISIQDHQGITEDQQQELANSIIGRIILKAPEEKKEELKALLDSEQPPNFK